MSSSQSHKLKIDKSEVSDSYAKFEIYPFERGFGNTFANPIRRILLSSIKGTSVTSIKVKGIDHEFSSLKGVKEDTLRLILNFQKVVFGLTSSEKEKVVLKVHGKKTVTAADIKVPGNVEVINPDFVIAELTDDSAQIEIEAVIETGYGFELADNEVRNSDVGTIPVNKNFSPIEKVNFNIESTRVAQKTDYEKIVLEIWTNGAVKPIDALEEALNVFNTKVQELSRVLEESPEEEEEAISTEE